jgi:hypothetical protein
MELGRPHLGVEIPTIYYGPHSDEGYFGDAANPDQLVFHEVADMSDIDFVSEGIESFMTAYYGNDRYPSHNDRILGYYSTYSTRQENSQDDQAAIEADKMAIILHDFVERVILSPEKTAAKRGLTADQADAIKMDGLARFEEILGKVKDPDGLMKAYLFAIDVSKWESAAQVWRERATDRINEMRSEGRMSSYSSVVVNAAINKTPLLDSIDKDELTRVLKMKDHCLIDLKLGEISQGTLNHNIQGVFLKGLETLDNIEHPPRHKPASTYRDCTEAINFFVPALATLGYKKLAMDLRGAALKWLFDDPHGHAERQHTMSERYFKDIQSAVVNLREQDFGGLEIEVEDRVKTEGSVREKLAKEAYAGLDKVPDGIGFAFIVPDEMDGEEMMQFARSYMERLTDKSPNIVSEHPSVTGETFERQKKASGYEAIHMTFYYYPEDGSGEGIPFEIQVITRTQNRMKLYGRSSDLFYKAGTSFTPADQPHFDRLAKRGQAEREMAPGSTAQSIAEEVAVSPEIPFVFNELFRAVDTPKGGRVLVPIELEATAQRIAVMFDKLDEGDLAVLPPTYVSEAQFTDALNMFDRELASDKNILNALALIKNSELDSMRDDGVTPTLEGHLLPVALSALMLAIQSGTLWDSDKLDPKEYMSNIVTITLLHDYVETALENLENRADVPQKRQEMLYAIKGMFGNDIRDGVNALTLPMEVEDQYTRREQYRHNIRADGHARLIKPPDRWQNHITDLIKLVNGQIKPGSSEYQDVLTYFTKTDRHQSADFTSPELPREYAQVHAIIWEFAKYFGYTPEESSHS